MDYKKIVKSRAVRSKILRALSFIPDTPMVWLQYFIKMDRLLNLKQPKRYTEKLQWYKLHYRDPRMIQCVDKYDVREYVRSKGLGQLLTECYGVYDRVEDVDFDALPNQFVLKDTLGGGGQSVVIVKDKSRLDIPALKQQMHSWIDRPHTVRSGGREWPYYSGKKHRIVAEQYLPSDPSHGGLIDYKYFCFSGKAECLYVIADRTLGSGAGLGVYTADFTPLPVQRCDEQPLNRKIDVPKQHREMQEAAQILSAPFPHARVDLYWVDDKIYFGEITFFDGSGYQKFEPDTFDFRMGEWFQLPEGNV